MIDIRWFLGTAGPGVLYAQLVPLWKVTAHSCQIHLLYLGNNIYAPLTPRRRCSDMTNVLGYTVDSILPENLSTRSDNLDVTTTQTVGVNMTSSNNQPHTPVVANPPSADPPIITDIGESNASSTNEEEEPPDPCPQKFELIDPKRTCTVDLIAHVSGRIGLLHYGH